LIARGVIQAAEGGNSAVNQTGSAASGIGAFLMSAMSLWAMPAAIFRYGQSSARVPIFSIVLFGGMGLAMVFSLIAGYMLISTADDPISPSPPHLISGMLTNSSRIQV
jgi:hypothetical protein